MNITGRPVAECKYGENPHQGGAKLYSTDSEDPLAIDRFVVESGQPLSFVNTTDIDRALETMVRIAATFEANGWSVPRIAIGVKHGNVCGAGVAENNHDAICKMVEGDSLALFGGFVMTNFTIDSGAAELLVSHCGKRVLDGVVAPAFTEGAPAAFARKENKCRLVVNSALFGLGVGSMRSDLRVRSLRGGFLVQESPKFLFTWDHPELIVRDNRPRAELLIDKERKMDIALAKAVADTANSNTIVLVIGGKVIAVAVGQQSRVGAAKLALMRARDAGHDPRGAVSASDSFYTAIDALGVLIDAGVDVHLTTNGSIRDKDVIALCEERKVALIMIPDTTGRGFFGH